MFWPRMLTPILCLSLVACVPMASTPPKPYTGPVYGLLLGTFTGITNAETGYSYLEAGVFKVKNFSTYFNLIDRSSINTLMKERQRADLGQVRDDTAPELGRLLGAQYLVKPSLSYARVESYQSGSAKYGYKTLYNGVAEVKMTLVHLETGKVMAASTRRGSSGGSEEYNTSKLTSEAIQDATNDAMKEIVGLYAARVN